MSIPLFVESAHDTPLVTLTVVADAGAASDPEGAEGFLGHVAELARRGAGDRDRAALDAALDALGAHLDVSVGRDSVSLQASCLARNLDALVSLCADVLARPRFDEDEHEQLRRETGYELDELRDDDGSLAHRYFNRHCAPGHPYARTALGTESSIAAFRHADVRPAYRRLFCRARVAVGFAGDVTRARAEALAERLTGELPEGGDGDPRAAWDGTRPSGRRILLVDKPGRQQSQLVLGHVGPRYGTDDFTALLVAETAFGGMFSSRMTQEIRVKRGWSYGASCRLMKARLPHWVRMTLAPAAEVTPDALALTVSLYESLREDGLTAEEVDFARGYLTGSLAFARATARQRLRAALRDHLYGLPPGYADRLPERLAALDAAAVEAALERCVRPEDLRIVVVATAADMRARLEPLELGPLEVVPYDSY